MDKSQYIRHISLLMVFLLVTSILFTQQMMQSFAAVPKLDQIRVALFIDARGTVPSVTLSSANGLNIGIRQPSEVKNWIQHSSAGPIRGSIDQHRLFLLETGNSAEAINLAQRVNGIVGESYILSQTKQGNIVYRVYIGQFINEGQAALAMDRLKLEAFLSNYSIKIVGPLHWNAGTFATEAEADIQLNTLQQNGLTAHLVYHENNERNLVYSVWVGEAANPLLLEEDKLIVNQLLPNVVLESIDPNMAYLIRNSQLSTNGTGAIIPYYFFNSIGQKVWITSNNEASIRVNERYNRTYRGHMELSQYKNRMAVINELPFEQYLNSVVSSELNPNWPMEALKAQAVAARTFALSLGMKYGIAHLSDTTYEQAYNGSSVEFPTAIESVLATKDEVITDKNGLIQAFYYSNAGGMTADTSEIWGTTLDYIKVVPSPDNIAEVGKLFWNRVVLPDGIVGYVRSDFTQDTGTRNPAGFPIHIGLDSDVNVRSAPYVDDTNNPPIGRIQVGDRLVLFDQTTESNSFSWIRGVFKAEHIRKAINRSSTSEILGELKTLEVSKRGPSGRVIEMKANGQIIPVKTPDSYRTAMNGLLSTRFDVEETGRYTIISSEGKRNFPENNGSIYAMSAEGAQPQAISSPEMFVMNSESEVRLLTKDPNFRFVGLGYGHGIGMSQWGARELAEFVGFNYQEILKYYYHEVNIVKD